MDMFRCSESLNTSMGKIKEKRQESGYVSGGRRILRRNILRTSVVSKRYSY